MFVKDAKRIAVFGASGSGKSTLTAQLTRDRRRVIAFDPLMDYAQKRNYTKVSSVIELVRYLKGRWHGSFYAAYVPRTGADYAKELHDISSVLMKLQQPYFDGKDPRKITLIVEEMNLSYPVTGMKPSLMGFRDLCSRGRHFGIEIFGISQRMAEVNTNFRGNASEMYFLRLIEHNDITAAKATLGPQYASQLRSFPNFKFLKRCENGTIALGDVKRV